MFKKIAVLADSHGNVTALKAVIADAIKQQVDEFWSLGDIAFGGSSSEECFEALEEVNTTQYLLGNWESAYNHVIAKKTVDLDDPSDVYFINLIKYDQEYFSDNRRQELHNLPLTGTKIINGINFSLTHNLPTVDRGHSLFPDKSQENFDELNIGTAMDVAIYAHTHTPLWRYTSDGQMILNPGSVGQPWYLRQHLMSNRDASYLILTISNDKINDVDFRRVPYNIDAEIEHAKNLGHPYLDLYTKLLKTGETSTHNKSLLRKINAERNYVEKADNFLSSL